MCDDMVTNQVDSTVPLERLRRVLWQCVAALERHVGEECWGQDSEAEAQWQRLFGKESIAGALAKLVAMHKSLQEQEALCGQEGEAEDESPLDETEWQLLAEAVDRWREGGG